MRAHRYRITISGSLSDIEREMFEGFDIEARPADAALTGELDQAGLYGALNRIRMPGLELAGVRRLSGDGR